MSVGRRKNAFKGMAWGIVNKIILTIMPFLIRTIIIYKLGAEYVGLSSLFTAILELLNLAEAGLSSAIVFCMYEPMAQGDRSKINAYLMYYKKCYQIIGCIVAGVGLLFLPFLSKLISGSYPDDINIYLLYLIYVGNCLLNYFMCIYKSSVLIADQRTDIVSNISTIVILIQYAVQAICLIVFKNYYIYIIIMPMCTAINNILVSHEVKRRYSDLNPVGELQKKEIDQLFNCVKGMVIAKISATAIFSCDTFVVSAFLGLKVLAKYNNYYMIFAALGSIITAMSAAIVPSIGNCIATQSVEYNRNNFKIFNFVYCWMIDWMSITFLCLCQNFMFLWVGKDLVLNFAIPVLFAFLFLCSRSFDVVCMYHDALGYWYKNRFIKIAAAVVNITLDIIMVKICGMLGVIISTIISEMLIMLPGYVYVLFKEYFKENMILYMIKQMGRITIAILVGVITYYVCEKVGGTTLQSLIVRTVICVVVPNVLMILIYGRSKEYKNAKQFVLDCIKSIGIKRGI